jgi:putative cell wall-binding protein
LSAGPVAVRDHAPILLTTPTSLPSDVVSTINTLNPTNIIVLGGINSVSDSVFSTLQGLVDDPSHVTRIGGADRFDASRNLAETFGTATTVFISNGFNFPDALSAGPAASTVNAPVLLVNGPASSLPAATLQLFTDLGTTHVVIAGGPNSVSLAIESQLDSLFGGANVTRLGGADRYEASKNINAAYFTSVPGAMIATGENFPDALAGGAYAGSLGEPLYTVHHDCIPTSTSAALASIGVTSLVLLGGPNTLNNSVFTLTHC